MTDLPDNLSEESADERLDRIVDEFDQRGLEGRKIDPELKRAAIDAMREVLALPDKGLINAATNLQNIAIFADAAGDRFSNSILHRYDIFHCRLIERGVTIVEADESSVIYLRCLVALGSARLRVSKQLGCDIRVYFAQSFPGFADASEFCGSVVMELSGPAGNLIMEVMGEEAFS